jgi:hypothetical protein
MSYEKCGNCLEYHNPLQQCAPLYYVCYKENVRDVRAYSHEEAAIEYARDYLNEQKSIRVKVVDFDGVEKWLCVTAEPTINYITHAI